jgi:hypothetical protein
MSDNNGAAVNGQQEQQHEGRGEGGRFAPGNRGGPGNPYARQTAMLRKAAADCVTRQDVEEIMDAMMLRAKAGDVAAAKFVMTYSTGRAGAAADPDTIEAHDLQTRRRNTAGLRDVTVLAEGIPAKLMTMTAELVEPYTTARAKGLFLDCLAGDGNDALSRHIRGMAEQARNGGQKAPMKDGAPSTNGDNGGGKAHRAKAGRGGGPRAGR